VFVELKARFDEENNFRWGRKMEDAGVKITYSLPGVKVHCKVALVKRSSPGGTELFGVLGTGNFHENNAALYTDHYLFTYDQETLSEVELLFQFFRAKRKGLAVDEIHFDKLLVGLFNLQGSFMGLIENEIDNVRKGLPAAITLKINALEERTLIDKLYVASQAGVKVKLIVRGICCLVPGVKGMSENIIVTRIVDRYLEHGRVFIFENNNDPIVIAGSSDWMARSMYRRIEVCFRVRDEKLKSEMIQLINMQLADSKQAERLDASGGTYKITNPGRPNFQSQKEISYWLASRE
jgi:polyphosphate kinase